MSSARVSPIDDELKSAIDKMTNDTSQPDLSAAVDATGSDAEPAEKRKVWGRQLELVLTLIGYSVGLGNIWRFPYQAYVNGGGAFLIPFAIALIVIGIPLYYLEMSIGQFSSLGPIKLWTVNPFMKGIGVAAFITNTVIGLYYNIVICWIIYYFFASMTSVLPWARCDHSWNTEYCVTSRELSNITGNYTLPGTNITVPKSQLTNPSEEYFYREVLKLSDGIEHAGAVSWELALCLLFAWIIVFFALIKGISTLGKVIYVVILFPYVLLTVMVIQGATLDGAGDGVLYYIKPDFNRLKDAQVWNSAASQIFFSLSLSSGGITAMSSYNRFKNNFLRDSLVIPIVDCLTSFYGGFAIFSVLGYMAKQKDVPISEVATGGPGLIFVVYPEALALMPVAPLWSILFFLMMLMLGLSTMLAMAETFFSSLCDELPAFMRAKPWHDIVFRAVCCMGFYLLGLTMITEGGFYLFNLLDTYISGFPMLLIGAFECFAFGLIYGFSRYSEDVKMMLGKKPNFYYKACIVVLAPEIIIIMLLATAVDYSSPTMGDYVYPWWAEMIGWMVVVITAGCIPLWWIIVIAQSYIKREASCGFRAFFQLIEFKNQPTAAWGPALPEDRTGRYEKQGPPDAEQFSGGDVAMVVHGIGDPNYSQTDPTFKGPTERGADNGGFDGQSDDTYATNEKL